MNWLWQEIQKNVVYIAKMGAHHDFKNKSMTQKMSKDVDDKNVHTTGIAALRLQKKVFTFCAKILILLAVNN